MLVGSVAGSARRFRCNDSSSARNTEQTRRRDAMAPDTATADVERLQKALINERELHGKTRRILREHLGEILTRIEAIERRQEGSVSMAQITAGLAAIRADLRGEVASLRAEVAEMAEQLAQFVRG